MSDEDFIVERVPPKLARYSWLVAIEGNVSVGWAFTRRAAHRQALAARAKMLGNG